MGAAAWTSGCRWFKTRDRPEGESWLAAKSQIGHLPCKAVYILCIRGPRSVFLLPESPRWSRSECSGSFEAFGCFGTHPDRAELTQQVCWWI